MKRDLELLREMLLYIEKNDEGGGGWISDWGSLEVTHSKDKITEHVMMLWESGLIDAADASSMSGRNYYPRRITMQGHDYLDSIRSPKVWEKTKEGLVKVGGSTSLAVVQALAVSVTHKMLGLS